MSSSTDQIPGTSQSDGGKLSAAVTNSLPVTMNGPTNGQGILTNSNVNFSEQPNLTFGTHDPLTQYTNHQTLGGLGVAGYSAFPSAAGDGSWTPTFDPNIMGGFSFTPNVLTAPNQFFFPSTDVWGQDPLMMNSMNNSWLLSSVHMDQSQIIHNPTNIDGSVTNTLEPVSNIEQTFSSLSLNGAMLPTIGTVPLVDTTPPQGVPSIDNTSHSVVTQPIVNPPPPQETKPKSWAAIASQPAKPKPPPPKPAPQPKEEVTRRPTGSTRSGQGRQMGQSSGGVSSGGGHGSMNGNGLKRGNGRSDGSPKKLDVVTKLKSENSYNPSELTMNMNNARYFVIKSYAEDDVHRSIKYNVWCSTEHGNRRLDSAFKEQKSRGGAVYLFFSVNGSGHFCGVAQMISEVDLINETGIWTQDKWKGKFDIRWIYVKDVPNNQLRHIRLENNENKPVTNSRDTQEVPIDKGKQVIRVIHAYNHTTSIFDDFEHYEKRQEEDNPPPVIEVPTTTAGSRKDRKS